jgi:threonine dehydrogenase-like Zn-dependent dehydrogenase
VGCFVDSCGECEYCLQGEEQYCTKGVVSTYNALDYDGNPTYGGYSQKIVVTEGFVVRIPDALGLDAASPLLCAGITTYSPLRHWKAGPGKKVAIVGVGGLGHLAIQFAHAMGAEVTVLSRSRDKEAEARSFGADHYFATGEEGTFAALANKFDLILNTVSANLDVDAYLSMLRIDGTLVNVGAPGKPDQYHVFSLIMWAESAKPRRCWISPRPMASLRKSKSSGPIRWMRLMSGFLPVMCGTASLLIWLPCKNKHKKTPAALRAGVFVIPPVNMGGGFTQALFRSPFLWPCGQNKPLLRYRTHPYP